MTRYEFTERLRAALTGEIPDSVVEENLRFYDRYISDEISKGRSEAEVLAELGDARLIAKTILETWQSDDTDLEFDTHSSGHSYSQSDTYDSYGSQNVYRTTQTYEEDGSSAEQGSGSFFGMNGKVYRLDKWYLKLIPIAIILLILAFVFFVLFGVMKLTFTILTSPIFWGIILIMMVLGWFSRRR